jgi:hypothetical protein
MQCEQGVWCGVVNKGCGVNKGRWCEQGGPRCGEQGGLVVSRNSVCVRARSTTPVGLCEFKEFSPSARWGRGEV